MSNYSESELDGMTRADLDEVAREKGLNPDDYGNKSEEVVAILEAQGDSPASDTSTDDTEGVSEVTTPPSSQPSSVSTPDTGSLDPMLVDPQGQIETALEGRTSDPATHVEGYDINEVQRDPTQGAQPSDAEDYPFPQGGDVDMALVERVEVEGEVFIPPSIEDWVVLDGSSEVVPDALDGRRAVVINVHDLEPVPWEERDDIKLVVRTRDDYNATLYITMADVKEVQRRGVSPTRY